jgi:hypothetical protein
MWSRALPLAVIGLALAGCPGGDGGIGAVCDGHGDCGSGLQCVENTCAPRCQRAPECGDGYACTDDGLCQRANGQPGDPCTSEVECAPGLSCQLDATSADGALGARCTAEHDGLATGATCVSDDDCRNGTCALGRCVDLCNETRDCSFGYTCTSLPRIEADSAMFRGCLPSRGLLSWSIPVTAPSAEILVPVPASARSATVVFRVDDTAQEVGASEIFAPSDGDTPSYRRPCVPGIGGCTDDLAREQYFSQPIRHRPERAVSVLQLPPSPSTPLEAGTYRMKVSSFRTNGATGSAIPRVTAIMKMDGGVILDLHFHFLDLADHPCEDEPTLGGVRLDARQAQQAPFFQTEFLGRLRTIFASSGIVLGNMTYEDVLGKPSLDGLRVSSAGSLFELGEHGTGVNVFFVRSLSPVGIQAFGPNPGPAGLGGTQRSGIAIGVDTLCYRSWESLARITAHEIARYMGLYRNVELDAAQHPRRRDPIDDSNDSPQNLMFFSEKGGVELSPGQRSILTRSAVLR